MLGSGLISHPAFLFSHRPLPPKSAEQSTGLQDLQALQKLLHLQSPAPEQELNVTV